MTDLWIERTGTRRYTGRSSTGAEVLIGPSEQEGAFFTPGDLLKIALAACSGLSSDSALARRLGDDYDATIRVTGTKNVLEDRYDSFSEELDVDLSALEPAALERLLTVVHRAIDEHCTVGRTILNSAQVDLAVTGKR